MARGATGQVLPDAPTKELPRSGPAADWYMAGAGMIAGRNSKPNCIRRCRAKQPSPPRYREWASTRVFTRTTRETVPIFASSENGTAPLTTRTGGIVLLRPERIVPRGNLANRAADLEIGQMADIDRYFQTASTRAACFFINRVKFTSSRSTRKAPFKPGSLWLVAQPAPSGEQNRRRFVHSLATLDSQIMVDGGWMLPLDRKNRSATLWPLTARCRRFVFNRWAMGWAMETEEASPETPPIREHPPAKARPFRKLPIRHNP